METCAFCKIVEGAAPAVILYRDELVIAFMDIRPVNPGHVLVAPLEHAAGLAELQPSAGGRMTQAGMQMAAALYASGVRCEGVNFFLADGEVAGQSVFHVHLHVIPRYRGDGFGLRFPERYYGAQPDQQELEEIGKKIKAHLA